MPWIAPTEWMPGEEPTASSLNSRTRDQLLWLKAALDLVTDGTAEDSGTDTYLSITSDAGGGTAIRALRDGDGIARWQVSSDGQMKWGSGDSGDGWDAIIEREEARVLALRDTQFRIYRDDNADPAFGARITGETFARVAVHAGFIDILEGSDQPSPDTDRVRLYVRDSSGKNQLVARFDDGSVVQVAIQP